MGHWNHRVMRHVEFSPVQRQEVVWYAIHEVYYNDDGEVNGWKENPDYARGDDLEDLTAYLGLMTEALKHPVLDYETDNEA